MEILKDWGFSDEDIAILEQNDISFELLQEMSDEDFNCDIGLTIGKKIKLKKYLKQYKNDGMMTNRVKPEITPVNTVYNNEKGLQCLIVEDVPVLQQNYMDKQGMNKRNSDPLTNNSSILPLSKIPRIDNFEYTFPSTSEEFDIPILYINDKTLSPNVIRNILLETLEGQSLLKVYEKREYFTDCEKGTLVHCLINRCDINNICRPPVFLCKLAEVIISIFPAEPVESYFIPALTDKNPTKNAKGKIPDKWRNMLCKLRASGYLPKKSDPSTSEESPQLEEVNSGEMYHHIQWLEVNREPWNDVQIHWSITYEYRMNTYHSLKSADRILERWPILKSSLGPHLVALDFDRLFPNKKLCIEETWEQLFEDIYTLRKDYVKHTDAVEYFKLYNDNQNGNYNLDGLRLIILPFLLIGRARVGKIGMPPVSNTHEGFIVWCKSANAIVSALESRTNRYKSLKLRAQPCIVVVSHDLLYIEASYVFVDSQLWKTESPTQALDILFKLFFVFGLPYPEDCLSVWLLIQQQLYDIHLPKVDKKIPLVANITGQLKVLRK